MNTSLQLLFIGIAFSSSIFSFVSAATSWGYDEANGPSTWAGICQTGQRQSPVNIAQNEVQKSANLGTLEFGNYNEAGTVEVENNGHGVEITGFSGWANRPFIQGGGLGARYLLNNAHFHWDQVGNGSEHQMNGQHQPLEVHLVHVREGLTVSDALNQSNGLAVVGIFYKIGQNGTSLSSLENALPNVVEESETVIEVAAYSPGTNLPTNLSNFFRYNGSLTTPECQEAVVWTVMAGMQIITEEQLALFRVVHGADGQPLETNVRPVQALNGRNIQKN